MDFCKKEKGKQELNIYSLAIPTGFIDSGRGAEFKEYT